ncbi:hypothetical protein DV738_g3877, partial [Chaetothyriales sp. CBS 135597]
MGRIYTNPDTPKVDIPQHDLLTFLFESEHGRLSTHHTPVYQDPTVHVDALDPSNYLTRASLLDTSKRIAGGLRRRYNVGASGPGKDVVTVISHGQILLPAAFFGVIIAGGIFAAVSPHSSVNDMARQITKSRSSLIISGPEFVDLSLKAAQQSGLSSDSVLVLDSAKPHSLSTINRGSNLIAEEEPLPWEHITDPDTLRTVPIVLLWSSGTSGLPKAVKVSHRNIVSEVFLTALAARAKAYKDILAGRAPAPFRVLAHLSVSHVAGMIGCLVGPIYNAGIVFWLPKYKWSDVLESVPKYQITMFGSVPSVFLRIAKSPEVKDHFRSVVSAQSGSAPMDKDLQTSVSLRFGAPGQVAVGQLWGLSETTGAVTLQSSERKDTDGSIGEILPGVEIRSVDDDLNDTKPGEPGELLVRGPQVVEGYWEDPVATEASFVTFPDDDGRPWLRTGDIAVYRNGFFHIVDRKKELLKYKGYQVAPAELEGVLLTHPKVEEAVVIGVPGTQPLEVGSDLPRAYVVKKPGIELQEQEVRDFVAANCAPYKQLRGGVVFVDELPKNVAGKYLRRELRELARKEFAKSSKL